MRKNIAIIACAIATLVIAGGTQNRLMAQKTPPPSLTSAAKGDVDSVVYNWMWYLGMLRGEKEIDAVAMLELSKATGTISVGGQPCKLQNYRASINYQISGMREQYTCTLPNGQTHKAIEVVSGQYAWDEDVMGAGLEPGRGTATPKPEALTERLIRIWGGPQGAPKAAAAGGANTKVAVENGKVVVTFPIPGVQGATGKATLNSMNEAERVEVHRGNDVTVFTYSDYGDHNPPDDRVEGFFAGHILEQRNGAQVLDLQVNETEVGNLYVIIPVPPSVRNAAVAQH
jgi:hypothetical protein